MPEQDRSWAMAALAAAQTELAQVEVDLLNLSARREHLVATVTSLESLIGEDERSERTHEVVDLLSALQASVDRARASRVSPPKRRQDYESSTIRVLRIFDSVEGHPPLSTG